MNLRIKSIANVAKVFFSRITLKNNIEEYRSRDFAQDLQIFEFSKILQLSSTMEYLKSFELP